MIRRSCAAAAVAMVFACQPASRPDGVIVAAISSDPGHLNPAITTGGGVHTAAGLLYNGLVTLDGNLQPVPELAERWAVEDGGARYRFHLRPDVRWHDGVPFTSADVKFTFEQILLRYHARTRASLEGALAGIDAPDDWTVVFRFHEPYAPLLQQLDVVEAPILPRHVYEGSDPLTHPANRAPVGTGPYRFVSYAPDVEIRYEANPDYFRGKPAVDHVILRVIPSPGMQVVALEAGEVDWLFEVPGPERARLLADPGLRSLETTVNPGGSNCIMTVAFNLERPVLRDARVRRAIAHSIDRAQFVERVLFGEGRAATAPISSAITFAHATGLSMPEPDLGQADALLSATGWRPGRDGIRVARGVSGIDDGTRFSLEFAYFPTFEPYAALLRAQLRRAGIDLVLRPFEPAVFVDVAFRARAFDVAIVSYCNGTDPEIGVRRMYVSSNIGPIPFSNAAAYRNATVDSLFDAAGSTLDPAVRRQLYRRIQEIVVDELPYVWLVETRATRVYRVRCRDFGPAAHFAATARCDA